MQRVIDRFGEYWARIGVVVKQLVQHEVQQNTSDHEIGRICLRSKSAGHMEYVPRT